MIVPCFFFFSLLSFSYNHIVAGACLSTWRSNDLPSTEQMCIQLQNSKDEEVALCVIIGIIHYLPSLIAINTCCID